MIYRGVDRQKFPGHGDEIIIPCTNFQGENFYIGSFLSDVECFEEGILEALEDVYEIMHDGLLYFASCKSINITPGWSYHCQEHLEESVQEVKDREHNLLSIDVEDLLETWEESVKEEGYVIYTTACTDK